MAMQKAHENQNWENFPSIETPVNAQNLNKLDRSVDELDDRIIVHENVKATKEEVAPLVTNIEFNDKTGVFTITRKNGAKFTIDTLLETILTNWTYDEETQQLILTMENGQKQYIDLSALITQYEFLETETITFIVDKDGKVSAIVKEGSIEEKHLRPDYLAEIKVESAKAEAAKVAAQASEKNAKASETASANSEKAAANSATSAANSATTATEKASSASTSATNAKVSETSASASATTATQKANAAAASATNASTSATTATTQATNAKNSATSAADSAKMAQSYTKGNTNLRPNESTDNAEYYYEKSKEIYDDFSTSGNVTSVNGQTGAVKVNVPTAYGTCPTAANVVEKVVTISNNPDWQLKPGAIIAVKFNYTNTAKNPTINVNGTGAKRVWFNIALISTGNLWTAGTANFITMYVYDGTQYVWIGDSADRNDTQNIGYTAITKLTDITQLTKSGFWRISEMDNTFVNNGLSSDKQFTAYATGDFYCQLMGSNFTGVNGTGKGCRYGTLIVTSPRFSTGEIWVGDIWEGAFRAWKNLGNEISTKVSHALTFTGGVNVSYDGSAAKTVNIPTSLPANGGNADTVGGKGTSELQNYNNLTNKPTIPAAVKVKGNKESNYRTGNVNLTPANIGAVNIAGDSMIGNLNMAEHTLFLSTNEARMCSNGPQHMYFQASAETNYGLFYGVQTITTIPTWTVCPVFSGYIYLGSSAQLFRAVYAISGVITTSDYNKKKNIKYLEDDDKYMNMFSKLRPCSYQLKNSDENENINHDRTHIGMIAQDVEEVMSEVGIDPIEFGGFCKDKINDGEDVYSLRYEEFISLAIKAIQIEREKRERLEERVNRLEDIVNNLTN